MSFAATPGTLKPTGERTSVAKGRRRLPTPPTATPRQCRISVGTERRADQRRQGATAFANTTHSDATAMENIGWHRASSGALIAVVGCRKGRKTLTRTLVIGGAIYFVLIGSLAAFILVGPRSVGVDNVITRENAQQGTQKWQISSSYEALTEIQSYTSATSVTPGDSLTFYVSTANEGDDYTIEIYRLGWYHGDGARLMASKVGLKGQAQGYYNWHTHTLSNCNSCHVDKSTRLVEANWQPSYSLTIPTDWTTGVYLARFSIVSSGKARFAPFVVRGNMHSTYLAVTSDNTYQAYNIWGGSSLYDSDDVTPTTESPDPKGVMVSFNRPYVLGRGASDVLRFEVNAIRWMERQGYDLSYISSVDMHQNPNQLLNHRAYLSMGHDEYWSKEMRDGAENARDRGVGMIFLMADASYWQIRYQPDSAGVPNRTIICYKVETHSNDLARYPYFGRDNSRVTSRWRDPVVDRPENALIGIMYSGLTHERWGFPWQTNPQVSSPLLEGTNLRAGQQYGCNLVGYEWDRIFDNNLTPPNLQVLSTSHTVTDENEADTSNTAYYISPSGALVFATGSIYWTLSLDDYRYEPDPKCENQSHAIPEMQKLMSNVMEAVALSHLPARFSWYWLATFPQAHSLD